MDILRNGLKVDMCLRFTWYNRWM